MDVQGEETGRGRLEGARGRRKMGVGIQGKEFPAEEENLLNEAVGTGG